MNPELNERWLRLEKLKKEYQEALLQATPAQVSFKPDQGGWNMLQVLQHLILSEKLSMNYLIAKNYSNARKGNALAAMFRSLGMKLMLRTPLRFKAPPIAAIEELEIQEPALLLSDWDALRKGMYQYLQSFPEDKMGYLIFRHPKAGWLNIMQTLGFFEDHLLHHQYQLQRIRKAASLQG